MEAKVKPSIKLEFKSGDVAVPLRAVSYSATSEVLAIRSKLIQELSALDKEYDDAFEKMEFTRDDVVQDMLKVKDEIRAGEKQAKVKLATMRAELDMAFAIINTKNLTTEQKEELLDEGFWAYQDYSEQIKPAVDYFRQVAGV